MDKKLIRATVLSVAHVLMAAFALAGSSMIMVEGSRMGSWLILGAGFGGALISLLGVLMWTFFWYSVKSEGVQ